MQRVSNANKKITVLNPGSCPCLNESGTESETQKDSLNGTESETGTQEWPRRYRIRDQTWVEPRYLVGTGIPADLCWDPRAPGERPHQELRNEPPLDMSVVWVQIPFMASLWSSGSGLDKSGHKGLWTRTLDISSGGSFRSSA